MWFFTSPANEDLFYSTYVKAAHLTSASSFDGARYISFIYLVVFTVHEKASLKKSEEMIIIIHCMHLYAECMSKYCSSLLLTGHSQIYRDDIWWFFHSVINNISLLTSPAVEKNRVHNSPSVYPLLLYLHLPPAESPALLWLFHLYGISLLLCSLTVSL